MADPDGSPAIPGATLPERAACLRVVVMGVAGCGKSAVGRLIAQQLGLPLIEGDDFHPRGNVEKMQRGVPLTDDDRAGWLQTLAAELARHGGGAVLTCSALKRAYRDRLRQAASPLHFVYLNITEEESLRRVAQRALNYPTAPHHVQSLRFAIRPGRQSHHLRAAQRALLGLHRRG
ncbi:MAG: hypothetical protein B7Y42_15575 [Polaromonas sp. 28-63-22]|nr:MAG: hypothetical protein B7Y42_15575 [Polaromonas sp. 28-63-22]